MEHKRRIYPWAKRRRMLFAFAALLGLAVLVLMWLFPQRDDSMQEQIAVLRAQGYPATAADVKKACPPPSEREDAANGLGKALATLHKPDEPGQEAREQELGKMKQVLTRGTLDADTLPSLEKYAAENAETLRLLHEASGNPLGRFPVDWERGYESDVSHARKIADAVVLLAMDACLAAKRGEVARAVESVALQMKVADTLRDDPVVLSQIVRNVSQIWTCHAVRHILAIGGFSDAQLVQIGEALHDAEYPEGMASALAAERAIGLDYLDSMEESFRPPKDADIFRRAVGTVKARWIRRRLFADGEVSQFVSTMKRLIDATELPIHEGVDVEDNVTKNLEPEKFLSHSMLLPAHPIRSLAKHAAILRATRTALAIERTRLANGDGPPPNLQELTPANLPAVPLDPFTGNPLNYRTENGGYVLNSAGPNLVDENGAGDDIMFRVEHPV